MERILRLTGLGMASQMPDTITISLSVKSEDKDYQKAMEECDKLVLDLKSSLAENGFKEENIKTTDFRVSTATKYVESFKTGKYVFDRYVITHSLEIKFDFDRKKLAKCIDTLSATLANPTLAINFSVEDITALKNQALKQAVSDAKEKALLLADSAGVKLEQIMFIDHSFKQVNVYHPRQFSAQYDGAVMAKAARSESMESINVEDIKIEANVTMEWSIK